MGILGDRVTEVVEGWNKLWKERLRGFVVSLFELGLTAFFDFLGKGLVKQEEDMINEILALPDLPKDIRILLERTKAGGGEWQALLGGALGGSAMAGAASSALLPPLELLKQIASRKMPFQLLPEGVLLLLKYRGFIQDEFFRDQLKRRGYNDTAIDHLVESYQFYPSPGDLVRWQAREVFEPAMVTKYGLDDELEGIEKEPFYKAGMTDDQIRNFWRAHWEHPELRTIIEMLRRTDFTEADMRDWFRLVEIPPYWRDKLIAISWEVPTRVDVRRFWDMRTIDEARLREIYTWQGYHGKDLDDYILWTKVYVAFPDLIARWRNGWISLDDVRAELTGYGMPAERLEELIETKIKPDQAERTVAERNLTKTDIIKGVKVERITRGEGIELLVDLGYDEDEAEYILAINVPVDEQVSEVTKRAVTKADIYAGLKDGIITEAEALTRLGELRYTPDDAALLLDIMKARIKPPADPRVKEASKTDIVLGVKKGVITAEDGYLMLQDIGYSPEAAQFILTVKTESSPFSPINFAEFKDQTQMWRRAVGKEARLMPEELKAAGDEFVRLTREVEVLQEAVEVQEGKLVQGKVLPKRATAKLDELRVTLHRAEAELARAKNDYAKLLAQWRHGPGMANQPQG